MKSKYILLVGVLLIFLIAFLADKYYNVDYKIVLFAGFSAMLLVGIFEGFLANRS